MEDESANVLPVVLASLRRILSCMGCGKRLVHPYRGTCFHAFCKYVVPFISTLLSFFMDNGPFCFVFLESALKG